MVTLEDKMKVIDCLLNTQHKIFYNMQRDEAFYRNMLEDTNKTMSIDELLDFFRQDTLDVLYSTLRQNEFLRNYATQKLTELERERGTSTS